MKKKTKKILTIIAIVVLILGFVAYEAGSLYFPLKYNNDYTIQSTHISNEESEKLNDIYTALATYAQTYPGATVFSKESYTVENINLPDGVTAEEIPESLFEAFGLVNKEETTEYNAEDYIAAFSDFQFSLFETSDCEVKENKNGSKDFSLKIADEMCYFTGLYLYKVRPYISTTFANQHIFGFHGADTAEIKELTSFILRDADILFKGSSVNISIDKEGRITHMSAEIPIKCEARVMSGLFSKDTVTAEITKNISYDIEYK